MLSESELYILQHLSLMFGSLYYLRDCSYSTGHLWWIQLVALLPLALKEVFLFCSSPVNAVREREKSLHVVIGFTLAIGFTVTCHKFAFHVHDALMPIWNTHNRTSFVWFFTFALHVHVLSSRIDGIPALGWQKPGIKPSNELYMYIRTEI